MTADDELDDLARHAFEPVMKARVNESANAIMARYRVEAPPPPRAGGHVIDITARNPAAAAEQAEADRKAQMDHLANGISNEQHGNGRTSADEAGARSKLSFRSVAELRAAVTAAGARPWLVHRLIPGDLYGMLGGPPKAQKTWNASDLAVSVASNTPWLDHFDIGRSGPVIMFAGEGGDHSILRRIDAIADSRNIDADSLPVSICTRVPHLSNDSHLLQVSEEIRARRPVLVIVDPLYLAARGGKASDLLDMGALLEGIQLLCQAAGCCLVVVHHFNRIRDAQGLARFSGAGPAEWGRFLLGARVISDSTDQATQETRVTTEVEMKNGDVADAVFRIFRSIRADDPDDLSSPLHYRVVITEGRDDEALSKAPQTAADEKPAVKRVLAVLPEEPDSALDVPAIGDLLAESGRALKERTIQDALSRLAELELADATELNGRGKKVWWRLPEALP